MKSLSIILTAVLLSAAVFAAQTAKKNTDEMLFDRYFEKSGSLTAEGKKALDVANSKVAAIDPFFMKLFGSESATVHITLSDNKVKTIGIVTKDARIVTLKAMPAAHPGYIVNIGSATVQKISSSKDQYSEILSAIKNKSIKIEATGWDGKIKLWLFEFFLGNNSPGKITANILLNRW